MPNTVDALFAAERLPAPPMPARVHNALVEQSPLVFATRPLPASPYQLEHFLEELERNRTIADYAVAGFAGHGMNSRAAHSYVVSEALALFVQLPWGCADLDADAARDEIAAMFDWSAELQARVAAARDEGRIPEGWRLVVSASHRGFAGWCWLSPNAGEPAKWREGLGMKAAILSEVADVRPESFFEKATS